MAIRENIKDPLGILNNSDDNHPDPLGILKKKVSGSELKTGSEKISPSPSPLKSHLTEEQTKQEIDYLNSPQGNKLKPFSDNTSNAPSRVSKEVANIEEKNRVAKIYLIDESVKNSPNLESAISKINNVDLSKVSEARAGQTIYNTLHDPAFIERTQDDPKLAHDAAVIKNNLAITHPAFGLKMVEQKIGQHIQDSGKNSLWYEHPDEASMDSAVEDMVSNGKMTQQERVLYMKNKGLVKDWVKYQSPALIQSLRRGAESGLMGLESSIRDLSNKATGGILESAGLIENNEQRAERQTAEQDATPQIEPKTGTGKAVKGIGELTGFLAPMVLTTILTKGAGATGEAAEAIPMIAQFEGINADRSRQLFPGDTKTQLSYTLLGSTIDASLGKILPTGKAARNIISLLKKDAAEVAGKMTGDIAKDEALKKGLLDRIKSFVGETAENSAHTANAITGFQMLHNGLDAAFGKRDFNLEQEAADAVDTWKSAFVSGLPLAGIGAANKLMSQKIKGRITVDVAENPEKAIQTIEDHAKFNPELEAVKDEGIRKIQDVSKAWGVIKELPLSEAQKEKFLLKDQEQKALDKQAATANVDVVKEDLQNKANEAYADKVKLYNGTDTAPEHEQYQEKVKTPDEVEPELQNQLGEGKAKQAAKEINEIAEYDLWPEGLQSWEKESAKQYPLQFLKEVSDQLGTVDKVDEKTTASPRQTAESKYGKDIVKLAEEYFPNEKDKIPVPAEGEVPPVAETGKIVEPTKEGGGAEVPPETPKIGGGIHVERPNTELSHRGLQVVANEFSLPDVQKRETKTDIQLLQDAREATTKWVEDGSYFKRVEKLTKKAEGGEILTDKERVIMEQHLADLSGQIRQMDKNTPEFDAKLKEIARLKRAGEKTRSEAGAALRIPGGGSRPNVSTLEDAMVAKMEANGVDELTKAQKEDVEKKVTTYKKKEKKAKEKLDQSNAKLTEMLASEEVSKKAKQPRSKKTSDDYKAERKSFLDELRAAKEEHLQQMKDSGIQQMGATPFVLTNKMAKAISKIVVSHVEEAGNNLAEITKRVFDEVKDVLTGISEQDIHDVIAGKYNEKKETQSELQANLRDLHEEAKLANKLEDLLKDGEPKSEKTKVERNQKIKDLREKINAFRKEERESGKFYGETNASEKRIEKLEDELQRLKDRKEKEPVEKEKKIIGERERKLKDEIAKERKDFEKEKLEAETFYTEEIDKDAKKLLRYKKMIESNTARIKQKIANKDYSKPENESIFDNKEFQKKYPELYKETLSAIHERDEAKHQFDIDLMKDEMSKRSSTQKAADFVSKLAGTAKAVVTGIDDSAVAVQTYMALITRPGVGREALAKHISHAFSQTRFDNYLTELHYSKDWDLIQKSGLNVTEPKSLKEAEKEEAFNNRFSGTIKIKGEEHQLIDAPLRPFERAFTTLGNVSRVAAFKAISSKYLDNGITFEKDPSLFKSIAQRLNTETGRGKENEHIERASKLVTLGIWSPKLMSSKFNILGVSDLASLVMGKAGTKGYYRQLHPKERLAAAIDVAKFATAVVAASYGLALSFGGDLDTDPLSSTFMDIKMPNGKSYNLTGGFSGYIRAIAQFAAGRKHKDGISKKSNRLDIAGRFFRSKLPPVAGSIANAAEGKDFMGKPTSLSGEAINLFTPISLRNITDQIKRDGAESFFTQGVPTFFGFNIKDERDFNRKDEDLPTLLQRNMMSDEMDRSTIKDYKNGGKIITDKQFDEFADKRDTKIKEDVEKMFKEGVLVLDGEKVIRKKYEDLTREEVVKETSSIKSKATKETKEELFGAHEKTREEKRAEKKLKKAKKQDED